MQKATWLSEEALQIAEKRKEAKGKGEKERYTHLNADFQRVARKDKKTLLSEQCKEIKYLISRNLSRININLQHTNLKASILQSSVYFMEKPQL